MFGGGMLGRVCVFREMYGECKKKEKEKQLGFIGHVSTTVCSYHYLNGLRWQNGGGGNIGNHRDLGSSHPTTSRGVVSIHVA
jgi:hypothetical protein